MTADKLAAGMMMMVVVVAEVAAAAEPAGIAVAAGIDRQAAVPTDTAV